MKESSSTREGIFSWPRFETVDLSLITGAQSLKSTLERSPMKQQEKLDLSQLQVKSFVINHQIEIKGGSSGDVPCSIAALLTFYCN